MIGSTEELGDLVGMFVDDATAPPKIENNGPKSMIGPTGVAVVGSADVCEDCKGIIFENKGFRSIRKPVELAD